MGKKFGNLAKVRGIVYFTLSPFEQKGFAGALAKGLPNMWRRFSSQVFKVVPPLVLSYLVFDFGKKENLRLTRKDPNEYVNDK